jgi:hypothetical protein
MANLQKNVASQNMTFCMVTTAGAADASATVAIHVTKDNGSQASGGGTVTNSGNGQYNYAPTQAETNATDVGFLFTASGDVPVNLDFHTDIVNSSGYAEVDATYINGQTTSAAGTVTFPGTIASATNITAGTITTVTNLTNAPTSGDLTSTMKTSVQTAAAAAITAASLATAANVSAVTTAISALLPASLTANGNIKCAIEEIITTALTESATGRIEAAFKLFFNVASPTLTTADVNQTGDSYGIVNNGTYGNSAIETLIAALNNVSTSQVQTAAAAALTAYAAAQPSESYAANTVVPTRDQFLFMIYSLLNTFAFTGTTQSVKKLDNSTQAMVYSIDSATAPTEHTRTS